ncbi:MAG: hypothetical protein ACLP6W_17260 [Bryobacteraceae bacterium]
MGALVQIKPSRFASAYDWQEIREQGRKAIASLPQPPVTQSRTVAVRELRAFPEAATRPTLPTSIRDETLEVYAFIFCQGGFRQLGMTFEHFLLVAATVKPFDLPPNSEEASAL